MKLGVINTVFLDRTFDEALDECARLGLDCIEIGTGGYVPKVHCDPAALLANPSALDEFRERIERRGLEISALSIHGEPLHPDPEIAGQYDREFRATAELAERLGVDRLTLMAGLPGGSEHDRTPNWITYPFPPRNLEIVDWQWSERLIPYWTEHGRIAEERGLRLCFEMHPADLLYHPGALLTLREAVGPVICANLDPSHLIWQGMDIREIVFALRDAIGHVHAKDARMHPDVVRREGLIDAKPHRLETERSWIFRTVGYGSDEMWWRDFVSALRMVGYDDVLSIEHEDSLLDPLEGLERAVEFLGPLVPRKPRAGLWFE